MTWAERILWATLAVIAMTAIVVLTGHAPHEAKGVVIGYLGTLAALSYGSYLVHEYEIGSAQRAAADGRQPNE